MFAFFLRKIFHFDCVRLCWLFKPIPEKDFTTICNTIHWYQSDGVIFAKSFNAKFPHSHIALHLFAICLRQSFGFSCWGWDSTFSLLYVSLFFFIWISIFGFPYLMLWINPVDGRSWTSRNFFEIKAESFCFSCTLFYTIGRLTLNLLLSWKWLEHWWNMFNDL